MLRFLKRHKELLWFGMFIVVSAAYFFLQFLGLRHHPVHTSIDDAIPFIPAFIIPYVTWYFYIPGMMLIMCFKDKKVFRRQVATLFIGTFICIAIFVMFPTMIEFRPDASGDGFFLALCRLIFANDKPYNVLPSLHCYETTAIHLASFGGGVGRRHKKLRAASAITAVLICLSTVFVKQHSALDLISGCLLAVIVYAAVMLYENKTKRDKTEQNR